MSVLFPVDDGDEFSVPFSTRVEDEIMELLWEDGRLVVQSQRPAKTRAASIAAAGGGELREGGLRRHHRHFIQEDEVDSWLQYPFDVFDGGGFRSDLPCSPTPCVTSSSDADCDFGTSNAGDVTSENGASVGSALGPKTAVGELSPSVSNELTAAEPDGTTPPASSGGVRGGMRQERASGAAADAPLGGGGGGGGGVGEEMVARDETTVTSPPVGSTTNGMGRLAPAGAAPQLGMQREKRKREGRDTGGGKRLSDEKDVRFESVNAKERAAKSTPSKKTHRANVHNLSERRCRDRISRKMKALQELIPQCTKADKASLLDEAIEYLKSLQLQVQMMSMGCGVVPVVFPGVQAYVPCVNMGTAMNAGMNPPTMLYPNILASSMMQPSANGVHLSPGWLFSTASLQQGTPDQFKRPPPNHLDPTLSSQMIQNLSKQNPVNAGSFQQQMGLYYMQQPPQ